MTLIEVDPGFGSLLDKVERVRGFACASYKHSCLHRRIKTRMRARQAATCEAYMAVLDRDSREMDKLIAALTINVTRFFRNQAVWEAIADTVVPRTWASEANDIRVWSAGCASGEEALSMAILFHRHAAVNGMLGQIDRVSVTGTDVDAVVLGEASEGAYSEADLEEVPRDLRTRYFSESSPFRPAAAVRRLVKYVEHDLLTDEVPREVNQIVICRNVLIYFERNVQEQVLGRLQDSLESCGYLILGKVESLLGATRRGFEPVAQRERIFRKIS
ncbi:MAG: protein-glutamate O-methyltransferase CheR [Gemmatimonadaceae bacterium]